MIASFSYDPLDRRVDTNLNGATTGYLYDGLNAVQETHGSTVTSILGGLAVDERFARTDTSGRTDFLTDALNSTIGLTNSSGALVEQYSYDPYGNTTASSSAFNNPFQYTGRENDGTGLYFYRARYYAPEQGRFISEDPVGFAGGSETLYTYVGGQPLSFNDPYGLWGAGLALNAGAEGGGPFSGAAAVTTYGNGFFSGQGLGNFTSIGGGVFAGPFGSIKFPADENGSSGYRRPGYFSVGAAAGAGASLWLTNANKASDLSGPFSTWNLNAAFLSINIQYSNGKVIGSIGLNVGAGLSFSHYSTNTIGTN